MNFILPSKFKGRRRVQKKPRTSTIFYWWPSHWRFGLTLASIGKGTSMFDLCIWGSSHRNISGHGTLPYSHLVWQTMYICGDTQFPKRALKIVKGKIYKCAKLFATSVVQKADVNTSPCFSNQGARTWLFLRCLLLAANSAAVCCSEEYSALEGSCPL